jgi:hypothetical protein
VDSPLEDMGAVSSGRSAGRARQDKRHQWRRRPTEIRPLGDSGRWEKEAGEVHGLHVGGGGRKDVPGEFSEDLDG